MDRLASYLNKTTNQFQNFAALMQNFGHAAEATNIALNSMGSAADENSRYMESLEAKTAAVKSTFQELSNNVIDSRIVKSILNLANAFLTLLNTPIGTFITQVVLLTGALWGLVALMKAMSIVTVVGQQFKNFVALLGLVKNAITGVSTSAGLMSAAFSAALPIVGLLSIAIIGIISVFDLFSNSLEKQKEKVANLKNEISELEAEISSLEEKRDAGGLTEADRTRLDLLEKELIIKQQLYDLEAQKEFEMEYGTSAEKGERLFEILNQGVASAEAFKKRIEDLGPVTEENSSQVQDAIDNYNYWTGALTEMADGLFGYYNGLVSAKEAGRYLSSSQEEFIDQFPELISGLEKFGIGVEDVNNSLKDLNDTNKIGLDDLKSFEDNAKTLTEIYSTLNSAVEEYNSTGILTADTMSNLLSLDDEYLSLLSLQEGKLSLNSEALYTKAEQLKQTAIQERIAALSSELYAIATDGAAYAADNAKVSVDNASQKLSEWDSITRSAVFGTLGLTEAVDSLNTVMERDPNWLGLSQGQRAAMEEAIQNAKNYVNTVGSFGLVDPSSSTSSSSKTSDPIKSQNDLFKKQNEIIEHNIYLREKQGADYQELIKLNKDYQKEIKSQADWFRSQGLSEESEYIRNLQKEWWSLQDTIVKLQQESFDKRLEISEDYISEKNDLDNWGADNEIAAYQRVLDWMDQWYKDGLIDYKYYWEKRVEIAKKKSQAEKAAWEESLQAQIEELESKQEAYEKLFSYMSDRIDEQISKLEDQRDVEEAYWDAKIQALEEQNNEIERQIQLEQLQQNLASAKQQQLLVYKDGRFQYIKNVEAISEAEAELEAFEREEALRQEVENLEKLKDQALASIDEQIAGWEKYKEEWSNVVNHYQEEQDRLLLEQQFGIELEGENWRTRLDNLSQYVSEYELLMQRLSLAQGQLNAGFGSIDSNKNVGHMSSGGLGGSGGVSFGNDYNYSDTGKEIIESGGAGGKDWSQVWWDAEHAYENGLISREEADKIQQEAHWEKEEDYSGSGATFNPNSGKWEYAEGTLSAKSGISLVGEKGPELRVLNAGDGIIPADITKNLWSWGTFSPAGLITNLKNMIFGSQQTKEVSYHYSFDKLVLPNATDANSLIRELRNFKNYAMQH